MDDRLHGGQLLEFNFQSASTHSSHHCRVFMPASYFKNFDRYPVIYMTDAQWCFNFYAETLAWKFKDMILVGVDQGNDLRRLYDFAYLGVQRYIKFFRQELVAHIESNYRTNEERSYMGISLGGLFGSILLSHEPVGVPFFKNYLLFDGTFNLLRRRYRTIEELRYKADKKLAIQLFFTSSMQGNHHHVHEFLSRYRERDYCDLSIFHQCYPVPHANIAAPSFGDVIDLL